MSGTASNRTWYPTDYIDEVCPQGFDSPGGWLRPIGDGHWTLKSPYHDDPDEEKDRWTFHPLDLNVPVEFCFCEPLAEFSVLIHDDGRFTVTEGDIDPRANSFMPYGMPNASSSGGIEDFVRNYIEDHLDGISETFVVKCAHWSEPMKFIITVEDKTARFEQVGTA